MGESGHSPALVGKHFIMNYYTILHDEPQSLYKFYKDDSVYSFGTEGEPLSPESTVTGQSNINEKIASLGFKKSKVHLSVMDAQPTLGGGVLLMVKGTITNETGNAPSPRKFVQTFLLAQQPTGYYVRNDILRYLADESAKTTSAAVHTQTEAAPAEKPKEAAAPAETKPAEPEQPAAPAVAAQQQSAPATPVPEAAQEETKPQEPEQPKEAAAPAPAAVEAEAKETPTPVAAVTPAPAAAAKETPVPVAAVTPAAAAPSAAGKASPAAKPARAPQAGRGKGKDDKGRTPASPAAAPAAAATETAAAAAPAAKAEPAPVDNSWAALAARKKDVPVTPLAAQPRAAPKVVKKAAPAAGDESATTSAAAGATPAKEGETAAPAAEQSPAAPADKKVVVSDPNSIYVSNLPFAAKQNQVTDAFKGFGKIVSVSMQNDKGYAFIEYDTIEAAHSAIKLATENPISMDGRVLRVEERKTKRGGSGAGGRKVPGGQRVSASHRDDRVPRGPRPEGKDRAAGSPRPNGSDRRDRAPRSDKRAPGTGSPAVGRPAAGGPSSGGPPRRPAPASTAAAASAPAAGGAAAGKK